MYDIAKLTYQNRVVGYRFTSVSNKDEMYDVELDAFKRLSINPPKTSFSVPLYAEKDLLLSAYESKRGIHAEDISENPSKIKHVLGLGVQVKERPNQKAREQAPKKSTYGFKGEKELVYSKGLSMILLAEQHESAEYETLSSDNKFLLVFETKEAIKKASEILGHQLNYSETLARYERGKRGIKVTIDSHTRYKLKDTFGCPIGIPVEGYSLHDVNHYSGTRLSLTIKPPSFAEALSPEYKDRTIGSSANSQSIEGVVKSVITALQEGTYVYYPTISLRNIDRLY